MKIDKPTNFVTETLDASGAGSDSATQPPAFDAQRIKRNDALHQIKTVSLRDLKPAKRNARTHSKRQIEQIAASIKRFGFITPIIVDKYGQIVAGHGRADAAKLLGLKAAPVIQVTDLSELELRAYALADNRISESAGWNKELLSLEIGDLQLALPEVQLDIGITGFTPGEVDTLLTDFAEQSENPVDELPELQSLITARSSDLFILGNHRLIVGDARSKAVYARLMGTDVAEMAFLDPPYNVPINGHVGGRGSTKHREFAFASGEMTPRQFTQFLKDTLAQCARFLKDGGISYVCMDWRHTAELLEAGNAVFDELKNICVWNKTTPGQGSFYRSQHEFVFVFKKGKSAHLNTFELGQHGRSRSNVWTYAGVNTFRAGRMDELRIHPTVKPVALIADAMRDCSRRGSIILDAFCGSGSTILSAEMVGRRAFCIEIDPQYVDATIRRWQQVTGKDAILESTGCTFDETLATRRSE
jgi:DNA modification methylase